MAKAGLKVIGIVCRSHLHCASAELGLRQFIGNNWDLAIHQRQQNSLSMQVPVAFIFFVYRDGDIAQHGLGTCGSNRNRFLASDHRIANFIQFPGNFLVLHFEIRNRRLAAGTPVDDVLPAIDQSFFIQADKDFTHRARKILVHGEVLAVPID